MKTLGVLAALAFALAGSTVYSPSVRTSACTRLTRRRLSWRATETVARLCRLPNSLPPILNPLRRQLRTPSTEEPSPRDRLL